MHNLFLGELRHHCRDVWGINVKDKSSDSSKLAPHTPAEQQTWLERVASYIRTSSKSRLSKVRKGYLAAVAELNGAVPPSSTFAKKDYVDALLRWWSTSPGGIRLPPVLDEATTDFYLSRDEYDISRFSVLDQATVTKLREDIDSTFFPSWLERPPRNFGSPSHGKLKADVWRTVCTVSMVITLVCLWGGPDASPRQKALLHNFAHLVSAVELAARRSTNQERIDKFDYHMMEYLKSLRELFDHELVPNHHLSLHLKECLELFGPVHAWWAFPFERFNGLLQQLNTNSKSSDMPITFMQYFYAGANLRSLMEEIEWPDATPFRAMRTAYYDAFRSATRGTRLADFRPVLEQDGEDVLSPSARYDEKKLVELPQDIYDGLLRRITELEGPLFASTFARLEDHRPRLPLGAQHVSTFDHFGITYAKQAFSRANSYILFRDGSERSQDFPRAGQIQDIFLHGRMVAGKAIVEPFFVINELVPLSPEHAEVDLFRHLEDIQSRLFYNRTTSTPCILSLNDIRSHFAAFTYIPVDIGEECIVIKLLDRVSGELV
ncbi:hypothetical protein BV20DRAFT_1039369 [Pilatotrama ljubarskyi]|nr:hypothetical protein BV20DRAFT_1039369 [Pilatotrama ljubarskyi]